MAAAGDTGSRIQLFTEKPVPTAPVFSSLDD